ncbi:MAG: zonular occludens toxin domain-containing protein [Acinetobacter sp.]
MLHLITGTPGAGKTLYAVSLIVKQKRQNDLALIYNATAYADNKLLIDKNDLKDYFASHTYFSKITKQEETVLFKENYFDYFQEKAFPDSVFLDIQFYNAICKSLKDDLNVDLKQLKDYRHIHANIDGLKVDNVRPIEIDWRKCPDGSIIFYDEIQLIPEYSTDNKQDKENIIKHLTIHRHRAFDIYGITQFPSLVHPNFRAVVGLHYHLHRGWGAPSATVYVWANCRDKPNSLGNKLTAERDFRFNYPKHLYKYYESATANTVRLRVPLKLFAILLIPLLGLFMLISSVTSNNSSFLGRLFGGGEKEQVENKQNKPTENINQTAQGITDPSVECRKGANVEKPECVKWFNDLSKPQTSSNVVVVSYDPSNPYDSSIQQTISYEVTAKPVFSGCTKFNGKYIAYTQQGTKLELTRNECKRLIDDGDRPFNYFQQEQKIEQVKQNPTTTEQHIQTNQQPETISQVDAQVKAEPIPLATKPPQAITGAHSL